MKKEHLLRNTIYSVTGNLSVEELLQVWDVVKKVAPRSAIEEAIARGDKEFDGNPDEIVEQWIPNCETDIVKTKEMLEESIRHLDEVKARVEVMKAEARHDKEVWDELRRKL